MKIRINILTLVLLLLTSLDSVASADDKELNLDNFLQPSEQPISSAKTAGSKLFEEIAKRHRFIRVSLFTGVAVGFRKTSKVNEATGEYVYTFKNAGAVTATSLHYDLRAYWSIFIFYGTLTKTGEFIHQTGGLGTDYRDAFNLTVAVGIDYYTTKNYDTWDFVYLSVGFTWGGVVDLKLTNLDITEEDVYNDLRIPQ